MARSEINYELYQGNVSGNEPAQIPRVPLRSIDSQGRIWPGGGLRRGSVPTELIYSYVGFTGTCPSEQRAICDQIRAEIQPHSVQYSTAEAYPYP